MKIKKSYKNDKCKASALTWNEEFELPDGSYSVSDIQGHFEFIIKEHETVTDNHSIRIFVISRKIKRGYYLELIMPETMKLLRRTKSKITKIKMVKICFL